MVLAEVRLARDEHGRRVITPVGEEIELPCDLALFAIGFEGVEHGPLLDDLGLETNRRGSLSCAADWQTSTPGVFVCGDAHRGSIVGGVGDRGGAFGCTRGRRVPDWFVRTARSGASDGPAADRPLTLTSVSPSVRPPNRVRSPD